jgi:putative DNA primase/helicase
MKESTPNGTIGVGRAAATNVALKTPTRTAFGPVRAARIPAELSALPQWVVWSEHWLVDHWVRMPVDACRPCRAKPHDPETWSAFTRAMDTYQRDRRDGIGFAVTNDDPYVVITLARCRDRKTGQLAGWATDIVDTFDTYTEIDPSGNGILLILRGVVIGGGKRRGNIEVFAEHRFVPITGNVIDNRNTIRDRRDVLSAWQRSTFGEPVSGSAVRS